MKHMPKTQKPHSITKLYDAYVKFFRWAADRLQGRDGIVCFVSNNSFVDQIAFDGMRKHLLQDFTQIYHLDLHGNVRKNPKLSGTTHNVFGIQVGVGITIASTNLTAYSTDNCIIIVYQNIGVRQKNLAFLARKRSIDDIEWQELQPDERYTWLTEGIHPEFATFLPIGTKEAKAVAKSWSAVKPFLKLIRLEYKLTVMTGYMTLIEYSLSSKDQADSLKLTMVKLIDG